MAVLPRPPRDSDEVSSTVKALAVASETKKTPAKDRKNRNVRTGFGGITC